MKITREKLIQLIKEEIAGQVPYDKWDPYRYEPMTQDQIYTELEAASRILEALPLEDLPEIVTMAAENLRKALEVVPAEEKAEPPPTKRDINSYLR